MSISRELKDYEANILYMLSINEELDYTELINNKKIAGSSRTIRRAINYLENPLGITQNNIDSIQVFIKSRKGTNRATGVLGRPSTYYSLTLYGLLRLFFHFRTSKDKLLKVFEKKETKTVGKERRPLLVAMFQDDIPLVFCQWTHFKKENVEKIAKKQLIETLKFCGQEYKGFLESYEDNLKQKTLHPSIIEIQEKWLKKKSWAKEITDIFLYQAFKSNYMGEHNFDFLKSISVNEKRQLEKAIKQNEKFNIYCSMLFRKETKTYSLNEPNKYGPTGTYLLDSVTATKQISNILWIRRLGREGHVEQFSKIADFAFNEDYFSVAVETIRLYNNYTFERFNDCYNSIVGLTKTLLDVNNNYLLHSALRLEEIGDDKKNETEKIAHLEVFKNVSKKTGKKITPKSIIKYWDSQKELVLSTFYFFELIPIDVWDRTYLKLIINEERIKRFEKDKEQVKVDALRFLDSIKKINPEELSKKTNKFFSPEK